MSEPLSAHKQGKNQGNMMVWRVSLTEKLCLAGVATN